MSGRFDQPHNHRAAYTSDLESWEMEAGYALPPRSPPPQPRQPNDGPYPYRSHHSKDVRHTPPTSRGHASGRPPTPKQPYSHLILAPAPPSPRHDYGDYGDEHVVVSRRQLRGLLSQKAAQTLIRSVGSSTQTSGASSPPDAPSTPDFSGGFLPLPALDIPGDHGGEVLGDAYREN